MSCFVFFTSQFLSMIKATGMCLYEKIEEILLFVLNRKQTLSNAQFPKHFKLLEIDTPNWFLISQEPCFAQSLFCIHSLNIKPISLTSIGAEM